MAAPIMPAGEIHSIKPPTPQLAPGAQPVSCSTPATITTAASEIGREDLPAQPHQLVIAVLARHEGLGHREHVEAQRHLQG